jgi:hypothetical protein
MESYQNDASASRHSFSGWTNVYRGIVTNRLVKGGKGNDGICFDPITPIRRP